MHCRNLEKILLIKIHKYGSTTRGSHDMNRITFVDRYGLRAAHHDVPRGDRSPGTASPAAVPPPVVAAEAPGQARWQATCLTGIRRAPSPGSRMSGRERRACRPAVS